MSAFIVNDKEMPAPESLRLRTYAADGLVRFRNLARRGVTTELILHETVNTSAQATVDTLRARNLGVHLILGEDGTVYQHGDLQKDMLYHAETHNGYSVGIEVVNPFEPRFRPKGGGAWPVTIPAGWAVGGTYCVPPLVQLEALVVLVDWLTHADSGLQIPQRWPALRADKRLPMNRCPAGWATTNNPGVHAHTYFAHGDGAFLVLYCWLRLEPKLSPEEAYEYAMTHAAGATTASVNLEEFFLTNPYLLTS